MTIDTLPRAHATVTGSTATFLTPDGHAETLAASAGDDIRHIVLQRATAETRRTGKPMELITSGDRGDHRLLISATGELSPAPAPSPPDGSLRSSADPDAAAVPDADTAGPAEPTPLTRRSFVHTETAPRPTSGWRAFAARAGLTLPESRAQQARREAVEAVSRHWAGPRNVAVVNGKGGIGKTMSTAMIASVFARHGGGNVLAWDNNDTRGTLGWRTEQGLYDTTIRDLLPAATGLLSPDAAISDISGYVHHQAADRYDVLRSNPELLAADQRIESAEFNLLLRVITHYYRLIVFDSGNDESANRWLRMVDSAHQLVIPTLPSPESAESAALLLDALHDRDEHSAHLAENAVVVVTQPEPRAWTEAERIAREFADRVRAVKIVPFDPALKAGPLRYDALRPHTKDAWLQVVTATATGLDTK